jgi:error-prone DNA polymerase
MTDLAHRVGLTSDQLEALATAGAFVGFGLNRREALWNAGAAAGHRPGQLDLDTAAAAPDLPAMNEPEQLIADMWATGISTTYPTALIRPRLNALGVTSAAGLAALPDRTRVTVGGIVTHRQRPPSAGGVTFLSLEDETGLVNVVVPATVWTRNRQAARNSGGLVIRGMLEAANGSRNVVAERIDKLHLGVHSPSRDFR